MIQIIENYLQIEKRTTYHILRLLPLLVMLSCMSIHSGSNELENFRFFKFSSVFKFASEFTFYLSDKHHFFFFLYMLFLYFVLSFLCIVSDHMNLTIHLFNKIRDEDLDYLKLLDYIRYQALLILQETCLYFILIWTFPAASGNKN